MRGGGALAITDPKEPREGDGLGLAQGSGLRLERSPPGSGGLEWCLPGPTTTDTHPASSASIFSC